ncbi:hypothetical protein AD006_28685 (plasmid) [Pseudonocardia sp. EC080610-09]|uniref:hypothetical protein n=1 Tax=Pseudonocardia sp. EC080619-01 TaxID=1096856 RepID=UPI000706A449|nr:hypothetical protein [Pseudonocardia sp. EC080619-01]ALL79297.1 hypothetical protein AD006_28685 [Pseudonocardia sp. EC080610-09]ALL85267.1 hypothetical protein AD017_29075 [Pseudonocardia sp. EC080619-01]
MVGTALVENHGGVGARCLPHYVVGHADAVELGGDDVLDIEFDRARSRAIAAVWSSRRRVSWLAP